MEILETYSVIITFYVNTTIFKIALLNELSDCKKPNYQPPLFSPPSISLLSMFTRYMLHVTRYCSITFSRWLYTGLWPGQRWRLGSGGLFGPSDLLPSGRHCG